MLRVIMRIVGSSGGMLVGIMVQLRYACALYFDICFARDTPALHDTQMLQYGSCFARDAFAPAGSGKERQQKKNYDT
jgi:hypothetical protein